MGQKHSLPDAPPTTPGGSEVPRSPNGGQLFKFEGDAYGVVRASVVPEIFDDGDDEDPAWILDVRARPLSPPRGTASFLARLQRPARVSPDFAPSPARGVAIIGIIRRGPGGAENRRAGSFFVPLPDARRRDLSRLAPSLPRAPS